MSKFKKLLGLYVLFGMVMLVYVSTVNSMFDIFVIRYGMSIMKYILLGGIFYGLFWLPYGTWMVLSRYPDYYVFSDKPIFMMLYILAFIVLSRCIFASKQNETEDDKAHEMAEKNGNGLVKFLTVFILTVIFAVGSCFQPSAPTINKENIKSIGFAYGAGPSWHDAHMLSYRDGIDKVTDELIQLSLTPTEPRELNNDLLAGDEMALVVAIYYEDIKTAKKNNEIGFYIFLEDGHVIVEDFYRNERHYTTDYTALESVLDTLENKANIGFMSMTRND